MVNFGMNPGIINGSMAVPVISNEKGCSIEENISKSGLYAREKNVNIGKKIEITPTIRNEEKTSVFDTSTINHIGGIVSGVQEIKENFETIHGPTHHDIIIDTGPVENDAIAENFKGQKTVKAVDVVPKVPETQTDFSLRQGEIHEIIDEIYDADIAPYHEFESIQRLGSPKRTDTKLTEVVKKVQSVASSLANASDFRNMSDSIVGADGDPQSMVALGKGVMKVAEFAGNIIEPIIEPAANAIGTKVRRVVRDDLSISQATAQDIGDISHVVAGLLIPGAAAKVISKAGKLTVFGNAVKETYTLDNVNKVPYNPKKAQHLASELLGSSEFNRTTVPGQSMPNVRLAGQCKERTIVINPETQETIVQRVAFDNRGFPIFDPYVKVEIRITGDLANMSSDLHMRSATRQLKTAIMEGRIDRNIFTKAQLDQIDNEVRKISGFTWHHHQEFGRMQLVPEDIHTWIKHIGGNKLWGTGQ